MGFWNLFYIIWYDFNRVPQSYFFFGKELAWEKDLVSVTMYQIFLSMLLQSDMIFVNFFTQAHFQNVEILPQQKPVNRDILNLKPYIFVVFIHWIGIISQFSYISAHFTHFQWLNVVWYYQKLNNLTSIAPKHIHKVNFYPSDDNFTQALLVMLVTNIISVSHFIGKAKQKLCKNSAAPFHQLLLPQHELQLRCLCHRNYHFHHFRDNHDKYGNDKDDNDEDNDDFDDCSQLFDQDI